MYWFLLFCYVPLISVRRLMKINERLYEDAKRRILSLQKNGFLTETQVTFLLDDIRKKLGLRVLMRSIYH